MMIRPAQPSDHPAFCELFPLLESGDVPPPPERFAAEMAPQSIVAEDEVGLLGCLTMQVLGDRGYVRYLITAERARRRGVGRALMEEAARSLREAGRGAWCLNVKPGNTPAIALYSSLGMRVRYLSTAMRAPWEAFEGLAPDFDEGGLLEPARDAEAEGAFALPVGQIAEGRARGRVLLATTRGGSISGLAIFNPSFPGAFPFRARGLSAARGLAAAVRPHAAEPWLQVVVEDDAPLKAALLGGGASVRMEIMHMEGAL